MESIIKIEDKVVRLKYIGYYGKVGTLDKDDIDTILNGGYSNSENPGIIEVFASKESLFFKAYQGIFLKFAGRMKELTDIKNYKTGLGEFHFNRCEELPENLVIVGNMVIQITSRYGSETVVTTPIPDWGLKKIESGKHWEFKLLKE